jgi:hypothetical protein
MATSHASSPKMKRARPHKTAQAGSAGGDVGSGLSALINSGLTSSFDAIKDKISSTIGNNGEEYLHEAVDKITESTAQVATWCKKNPIKMVVGIAALTAVSAFLVHIMGANGASGRRGVKKAVRTAAAGAAS